MNFSVSLPTGTMGGGTSRFEETDWETATGKLTSEDETIDGSPPTAKYGVYYVTKQGLNQRDFDVTDEYSNLIYSTKCVEGTLAWFDVMGPDLNQHLLRVQVDLSRRYWVIYRFGKPSYQGQFADMTATTALRQARGETQPCLYKKSCITVTWGRYHAIVNSYGPPPDEELEEDDMESTSEEPLSWSIPDSSKLEAGVEETKEEIEDVNLIVGTAEERKINADLIELGVEEAKDEVADMVDMLNGMPSLLDQEDDPSSLSVTDPFETYNYETDRQTQEQGVDGEVLTFDSDAVASMEGKKKKSKLKNLKKWVADASGVNDPPPDPLEGYLQLDKPVIKCEEINSFMGQHQTMLVGDKEAKQLEKEELDAAAEAGADAHNPNANFKHGIPEIAEPDGAQERSSSVEMETSEPKDDAQSFPRMRKLASWMKTQSQKVSESGQQWATGTPSCDGSSIRNSGHLLEAPEKEVRETSAENRERTVSDMSNVSKNSSPATGLSSHHGSTVSLSSNKSANQNLEPLVSFWNWDNTMRIHKMKMHIAEGSDLALHIVLAIVTNQLRCERNAVVSTV